jgi:hypothetical protein
MSLPSFLAFDVLLTYCRLMSTAFDTATTEELPAFEHTASRSMQEVCRHRRMAVLSAWQA